MKIIIYISSFLVGLLAHSKGKNGVIWGGAALILISGLLYLIVKIDVIWNFLIVDLKFSTSSITIICSSMIFGLLYGVINKIDENKRR